jgi:hypothetical protein
MSQESGTTKRKKLVAVDFDGVLHSYRKSGWEGAHVISDPPVRGAIEWLTYIVRDERFEVCISSSRSHEPGGIDAMKEWLLKNDLSEEVLAKIFFPSSKPSAHITLDDRALQFCGAFPSAELIDDFEPWWKSQ